MSSITKSRARRMAAAVVVTGLVTAGGAGVASATEADLATTGSAEATSAAETQIPFVTIDAERVFITPGVVRQNEPVVEDNADQTPAEEPADEQPAPDDESQTGETRLREKNMRARSLPRGPRSRNRVMRTQSRSSLPLNR